MGLNLLHKKHYVFDLDGTLIDSNSLHEKAFKIALINEKVDFSYKDFFGVKTLDVFLSLGFDFGTLSFDVDFDWSKSFEQNARFDFDLASYASMAGLDLSALGDMAALTDYLGAGTSGNLQFTAELSLMASLAVDLQPILQGRAPRIRINAFNPSGADGDAEGTRFSVETKILGHDLELAFQVGLFGCQSFVCGDIYLSAVCLGVEPWMAENNVGTRNDWDFASSRHNRLEAPHGLDKCRS